MAKLLNKIKNLKIKYFLLNKGSETDYNQYLDKISCSMRDSIAKSMTADKTPNFTIKDLDGKKVSRSDNNGKTLVLDF